jgi:hypothetical protein
VIASYVICTVIWLCNQSNLIPRAVTAGIWLPFVPVRIGSGHSAHVSEFCLLFHPLIRGTLSYALWEHNKVVIAFTSVVWLANTAIYIYSWYSPLSNTGSPVTYRQMLSHLAGTGKETLVTLTTQEILKPLLSPYSRRISFSLYSCSSASCAGKKPVGMGGFGGFSTNK